MGVAPDFSSITTGGTCFAIPIPPSQPVHEGIGQASLGFPREVLVYFGRAGILLLIVETTSGPGALLLPRLLLVGERQKICLLLIWLASLFLAGA